MKKIVIISAIIFHTAARSGMKLRERQVNHKEQRIQKALKIGTATTAAGIFYAGCTEAHRILGEFAQEKRWRFTINSVIPLRIAWPYWSSKVAALAQKVHLPQSVVETIKPYAAHKACRYPVAIGAGLIAAFSFYTLAKATNFFGAKALLHNITGLKQEKRQLKVDKNRTLEGLKQDVAQKNNQISRQYTQTSVLAARLKNLQIDKTHLNDEIVKNSLRATLQADEIRLLTTDLETANEQIAKLESKNNIMALDARLKTKTEQSMLEMINAGLDDEGNGPNIALYQITVKGLLRDWLKVRNTTDPIPCAFKQALHVISNLPLETRIKTLEATYKQLIDVAHESGDTDLQQLLETLQGDPV